MSDKKNLRKAKRVKINIPVSIYLGNDNSTHVEGEVLDISTGGAFIHCAVPIEFGQQIRVELKLRDTRMLQGKVIDNETWLKEKAPDKVVGNSVVRWARGTNNKGFGVEFVGLSKAEQKFIDELIEYCSRIIRK